MALGNYETVTWDTQLLDWYYHANKNQGSRQVSWGNTLSLMTIQQSLGLLCNETSSGKKLFGDFVFAVGWLRSCVVLGACISTFLESSAELDCTAEISGRCFLLESRFKTNLEERLHCPHVRCNTPRKSLTKGILAKRSTSMFSSTRAPEHGPRSTQYSQHWCGIRTR